MKCKLLTVLRAGAWKILVVQKRPTYHGDVVSVEVGGESF